MFNTKRIIVAVFSIYTAAFSCTNLFAQQKNTVQKDSTYQYNTNGGPVRFEFKYKKDDNSRILSTVNEDVYINRRLDHHAVIVNRISNTITDVKADGTGCHKSTFMTTEDSTGSLTGAKFTWGEEYQSIFDRDKKGIYSIEDKYFMPTVRDVPSFPDKEVKPGESWTAQGHEAHDLRRQFNLHTPYKVPFTATYTYLGTVNRDKTEVKTMSYAASSATKEKNNQASVKESNILHVINVKYNLYTETPRPDISAMYSDYPVMMMGYSDELIFWDNEKGAIDHYNENFRIIMETAFGNILEFRGEAHAEITEFQRTATDENVEDIQNKVEELGLENVTVKKSEKGLTLSIENIQFKAESAILLDSEKEKIDQIAKILESYPDNDILISGHTAYAPGGADPQILSEKRAQAVADYLIQLGVKDQYHIFTQGFGDKRPIVPNDTQENRAKNRRVEITIIDE
ncbi:MAG: OmpA family protein [Treponema sp.]|nr:OmpA family protein [Treponema sp.]